MTSSEKDAPSAADEACRMRPVSLSAVPGPAGELRFPIVDRSRGDRPLAVMVLPGGRAMPDARIECSDPEHWEELLELLEHVPLVLDEARPMRASLGRPHGAIALWRKLSLLERCWEAAGSPVDHAGAFRRELEATRAEPSRFVDPMRVLGSGL